MFVFYSGEITETQGWLTDEEHHHCTHVLRFKTGDDIFVTNGMGKLCHCTIINVEKSRLKFEVREIEQVPQPGIGNGIAMALTKSMDRMELFVEKAVEIGILWILLFETRRTERSALNLNRLQKTAISAMKQAKHCHLPTIQYEKSYQEALRIAGNFEQKFIASCTVRDMHLINRMEKDLKKVILIGPEGDFTEDEVSAALSLGYQAVSLGQTILRTETAAIVGSVLFESLNDKK
ncbi:MAG: 16S rRNA (uracil(1498)-N(3))-methyltransferase [Saprospiraceae bacterium]|nr:16S rRNA (uracil(1498)-N(3))-methyltransferase [Saprospiraceae bacterium]